MGTTMAYGSYLFLNIFLGIKEPLIECSAVHSNFSILFISVYA